MEMTEAVFLSAIQYAFFSLLVVIAGGVIIFGILFYKTENYSNIYKIFDSLELAKLLTVALIVTSVTVLCFGNYIDGDAAIGVFGSIAGFVLGGVNLGKKVEEKQ